MATSPQQFDSNNKKIIRNIIKNIQNKLDTTCELVSEEVADELGHELLETIRTHMREPKTGKTYAKPYHPNVTRNDKGAVKINKLLKSKGNTRTFYNNYSKYNRVYDTNSFKKTYKLSRKSPLKYKGNTYVASAAGEYPAIRTGYLHKGMHYKIRKYGNKYGIKIIFQAPYAPYVLAKRLSDNQSFVTAAVEELLNSKKGLDILMNKLRKRRQ